MTVKKLNAKSVLPAAAAMLIKPAVQKKSLATPPPPSRRKRKLSTSPFSTPPRSPDQASLALDFEDEVMIMEYHCPNNKLIQFLNFFQRAQSTVTSIDSAIFNNSNTNSLTHLNIESNSLITHLNVERPPLRKPGIPNISLPDGTVYKMMTKIL